MRRQERQPEPVEIAAGTSNFNRAEVPYGVDLAAAWSWRLLVIAGGGRAARLPDLVLRGDGDPGRRGPADLGAGRAGGRPAGAHRRTPQRGRDPGRARHHRVGGGAADLRRAAGGQRRRRPGRPDRGGAAEDQGLAARRAAARQRTRRSTTTSRASRTRSASRPARAESSAGHRGRHRGRSHPGRLLHRAVLDLLLPHRRQPDLVLGGPALARARRGSGSTARAGSRGSR